MKNTCPQRLGTDTAHCLHQQVIQTNYQHGPFLPTSAGMMYSTINICCHCGEKI